MFTKFKFKLKCCVTDLLVADLEHETRRKVVVAQPARELRRDLDVDDVVHVLRSHEEDLRGASLY